MAHSGSRLCLGFTTQNMNILNRFLMTYNQHKFDSGTLVD